MATSKNPKNASTKNTNLPQPVVEVTPKYGAILSLPVLDGNGNQKVDFRKNPVYLRMGVDKAGAVLTYTGEIKSFYQNHINDRPVPKANTANMKKADVIAALDEERNLRIELMKRLDNLEKNGLPKKGR